MIADSLVVYRIHTESVTNKHKLRMRQTHLKLVAENLAREALVARPEGLCEIGNAVKTETIRSAAEIILALEESISARSAETRPSYEEGALNLFYFLYQPIGAEQRPELTHAFLTRTAKWGAIRRRERYGLRPGAMVPPLSLLSIAATKRVDAVERYLRSVPVASALPHRCMA